MSGVNEKTLCVVDEKIFGQVQKRMWGESEEETLSKEKEEMPGEVVGKKYGRVGKRGFDEFEKETPGRQGCIARKYGSRLELLESRIELLRGKEKLLMTMYLKNGNSFYQMARLAGVNEVTIARRIYKIIKRLLDGEYITCLRNRNKFSDCEMAVAKDYLLTGLSMRKIARHHRCSRYRVRQTLGKILAISKIKDKM
jgi:hypothetical protein